MTSDAISKIIVSSLTTPDLSRFKSFDASFWISQLKGLANAIPYIGGLVAENIQQYYDYKDDEFFRKFTKYLIGIETTTVKERQLLAEDIQKKADDFSGNVILGMIDRLDNINKQTVFANLSIAKINDEISIADFFRLHSLLERIPYVDLEELSKYTEPYYDTNGDSELLFATGALEMASIDRESSNTYILSRLGEMLLRFGFNGIDIKLEHGKGTDIGIRSLTDEEIDDIVDKAING